MLLMMPTGYDWQDEPERERCFNKMGDVIDKRI